MKSPMATAEDTALQVTPDSAVGLTAAGALLGLAAACDGATWR